MTNNIEYCISVDINKNTTYRYIISSFKKACFDIFKKSSTVCQMQFQDYGLFEICTLTNNGYKVIIILNYDELNDSIHIDVSINISNKDSIKFKPIELSTMSVTLPVLIESVIKEYIEEFKEKYNY